ncbi:MAG: type II toxin-antitoxin system prevent-host-death family antitoxin [Candidatus Sulfotelmatobacter sp.]
MKEIGAFEAKKVFGTLLDCVQRGESIVITRHDKPVARLVPNSGRVDQNQTRAAAQRIRERAKRFQFATFDWPEVKALRDQGRR